MTAPRAEGRYPGIVMYSDIFQITGAQTRVSTRLAGYGFVVATPEIYHRLEPAGTALAFDDAGRTRGLDDAKKTTVARVRCRLSRGARLARRASAGERESLGRDGLLHRRSSRVSRRAAAGRAWHGVLLSDGRPRREARQGRRRRLARAREGHRRASCSWCSARPTRTFRRTRARPSRRRSRAPARRFTTRLFAAEHAFMRDEGPRYDPEATDRAWDEAIAFLRAAV